MRLYSIRSTALFSQAMREVLPDALMLKRLMLQGDSAFYHAYSEGEFDVCERHGSEVPQRFVITSFPVTYGTWSKHPARRLYQVIDLDGPHCPILCTPYHSEAVIAAITLNSGLDLETLSCDNAVRAAVSAGFVDVKYDEYDSVLVLIPVGERFELVRATGGNVQGGGHILEIL